MSDVRVPPSGSVQRQVPSVPADGGAGGEPREEQREQRDRERRPGAEELSLALQEDGGADLAARFEQTEDGTAQVRVSDTRSGETVAVLTPEELRDLAEKTGLPAGLLLRARS